MSNGGAGGGAGIGDGTPYTPTHKRGSEIAGSVHEPKEPMNSCMPRMAKTWQEWGIECCEE